MCWTPTPGTGSLPVAASQRVPSWLPSSPSGLVLPPGHFSRSKRCSVTFSPFSTQWRADASPSGTFQWLPEISEQGQILQDTAFLVWPLPQLSISSSSSSQASSTRGPFAFSRYPVAPPSPASPGELLGPYSGASDPGASAPTQGAPLQIRVCWALSNPCCLGQRLVPHL